MEINFRTNSTIESFHGRGDGIIGICPKCQKAQVGVQILLRESNSATCTCRNCNNLFIIEGLGGKTLYSGTEINVTTIPSCKSAYREKITLLPEDIQPDFEQAIACFEINAFDASITMSRRSLQHIARETIKRLSLKAKDDSLEEELKCLKDNQIIFPKTFDMYEQIKKIGNFGAHPDKLDLNKHITQEEAENALRVIILMVKEIYENDELYNKIMPQKL